ncbi:hypothetical protein BKH42_01660 [Helicobacter sp. 13S00482-2]|uniref:AzlC family ABC transporter permease n=1 Tax=Helicobacter sp. 13S00482-2 TaxID=1476200 RepID=UPI000BA74612|nr:AzlC family ABC transporter permease [Helicobacter sp. 13S00482-2]PAF54239.1 hypothetical protein BKH42_01660 [Helicobacter sp. 13S00482-2]
MALKQNEIFIALKDAFPHTIPIMMGYLLMGFAFGVLLDKSGYDFVWAFFMSVFIYAGAMQFVAIGLLAGGVSIWGAVVLSAIVNARQIFYSISMLEKFSKMGKKLLYMIHSLTDETFALFNVKKPKEGINESYFMFFIALFNHIYWIIGSVSGALIGSKFNFDSRGVEFVMTAIFVVIFMEQWKHTSNHIPAIVGICTSLICLLLCGENFLLPSLIFMTFILMLFRKKLEE